MSDADKHQILCALKNRLVLEVGLGIEFISGSRNDLSLARSVAEVVAMATGSRSAKAVGAPKLRDVPQQPIRQEAPAVVGPSPDYSSVPDAAAPVMSSGSARLSVPDPKDLPRRVSLVPYIEPTASPQKEELLASFREEAMHCRNCELCERRNSVVWGEGTLDAEIMFIGEGPGRDEDLEGRPFVGRSGRVLSDIIEKGMKLPRSSVYITNVVKCRPPGNRDPRPAEVAACSRYLAKQIEVISPKVIVGVGGVAGCALLDLPPKSPGLRGRWHRYGELPLRIIYHPSYLLRQRRSDQDRTQADRTTWADILEVMKRAAQSG